MHWRLGARPEVYLGSLERFTERYRRLAIFRKFCLPKVLRPQRHRSRKSRKRIADVALGFGYRVSQRVPSPLTALS